jgi:hypothetical protein
MKNISNSSVGLATNWNTVQYRCIVYLFPSFGCKVEAPEVLVMVELGLSWTSELPAKDPELTPALGY